MAHVSDLIAEDIGAYLEQHQHKKEAQDAEPHGRTAMQHQVPPPEPVVEIMQLTQID